MPPAKRQFRWLWHLLPRRGLTFAQRFVGVLATWGLPILVWEALSAGVFQSVSRWPLFLAIEVPATAVGALVVAALEHALLGPRSTRNCSKL